MEHRLTERRFTASLRFLHLHGGKLCQEKLPFRGEVLRDLKARNLVTWERTNGEELKHQKNTQVVMTQDGRDWLRERGCLTFGQERGLRQWDIDFKRLLMTGVMPTKENEHAK